MLNHIAEVGDYIKLSGQRSFIEGTVVSKNSEDGTFKVVFSFYKTDMSGFLTDGGEFDWYSQSDVLDIQREFKILDISEHIDSVTGHMKTWFDMSKINNHYSQAVNGYYCHFSDYNPTECDTFVFKGFAKHIELVRNPEENKRIWLSDYTVNNLSVNGVLRRGYESIK